MKTYLSDIIPKIQKFSEKLDNLTLLTNKHWVIIDNIENNKNVYIFRTNGELLISLNGRVTKGKWEFLGNNTLLIDQNNESYLYKHGFFDENILALKIDGINEYTFLVNETRFNDELNTIESITEFLHNKYLSSKPKELLSNTDLLKAENLSKKLKNDNFIITNEEKNWSIATGKYIKYNIKFSDKSGEVLFDSKKGMFCYSTYDKIEYFDDLEKCILSYKHYLDIKE